VSGPLRAEDRPSPEAPARRRRSRPVFVVVAAVLAGAVAAVGITLIVGGSWTHPPAAAPLPAHGFSVPLSALPPLPTASAPKPGGKLAGPGRCDSTMRASQLLVPDLCIDGSVVPTGLQPDGSLIIPANDDQIGVWDGGPGLAAAGSKGGTTLLAGHVDYVGQGDGALYRLSNVTPGMVICTVDASGTVSRWRAVSLRVVVKAELSGSLFAGYGGPRLRAD